MYPSKMGAIREIKLNVAHQKEKRENSSGTSEFI